MAESAIPRRGSIASKQGFSFMRNMSAKTFEASVTGERTGRGSKSWEEEEERSSRLEKPPPLEDKPHRGGLVAHERSSPSRSSSSIAEYFGAVDGAGSDDDLVIESLKEQVAGSKAMVANYAEQNRDLQQQVDELEGKMARLMEESSIKNNPAALAALVAASKRDMDKMAGAKPSIEAMAAVASRDEQITTMKTTIRKRDEVIRELKANMLGYERQHKDVMELQAKLKAEREALAELGKDEMAKAEMFAAMKDELEAMKSKLASQQMKHDEELKRLRAELQKLGAESIRKIEQLQFYAEAMRKRAAEMADTGDIDGLNAKLRELQQALSVSEDECERLRRALSDAEEIHRKNTRRRRTSIINIGEDEQGGQACKNCARMSEDLQEMQFKLTNAQAPFRGEIGQLKAERDALLDELAQLRAQLSGMSASGNNKFADHSECDAKIRVLTSRLKRLTDWHNKEMALGKTIHPLRPRPPSLYDSFQEVEFISHARRIGTSATNVMFHAGKASRPSTAASIIQNASDRLDDSYIAGQRGLRPGSSPSLQLPSSSRLMPADKRRGMSSGVDFMSLESRPITADSRELSISPRGEGREGFSVLKDPVEGFLKAEAQMPPVSGSPSNWGLTPSDLLFSSPWKAKDREAGSPSAIGSALQKAGPRKLSMRG